MRLPNINNVSVQIGNPVPQGYTVEIYEFFLGEDILFRGYAAIDSEPLDINKWTLKAIVKSNSQSTQIIWEGFLNNGITMSLSKPGEYKILIPKETFNSHAAGTYWLGLLAKEKLGQGKEVIDRSKIIANIPFSLIQAVGSNAAVDIRLEDDKTLPLATNITKL
jgi:hypothetical protein